ncbi:MAG: ABC transporter substrate-binding protein [Proteobacteria bacterium]|nr:ABC transporter substrate-binding protein [Desulfobacula sp.]MBU3954632.1 ABC transporter substrate-binding protein [Pseudomonadota bacterium]MBU4132323.1 ABC transporter substrate-binding protein [Pseudomonadota bacterium]
MNRRMLFWIVAGFLGVAAGQVSATTSFLRVISLSPIITETIYLVGAQEKLIADTTYCNTPKAAQFKEKIGSVTQMNVEKIIRLQPDLVIASALSREKQLKILEGQSIPILRAQNPKTFEQMCEMTLMIGKILEREQAARIIVDKAQKQANQILERTRNLAKPKVFLQIGLKPLHSANREMFINEYIRYGGGINIAENESSGIYSREKVIRENPDVILIVTMGSSKRAGQLERRNWMAFKSIDAVKKNRVHVLDPEMICSPTPDTFVEGLGGVLPLLHPEIPWGIQ